MVLLAQTGRYFDPQNTEEGISSFYHPVLLNISQRKILDEGAEVFFFGQNSLLWPGCHG